MFRIDLLETEILGWPAPEPCDSARDSLALSQHLEADGIAAIIPQRSEEDAVPPWIVFNAKRRTALVIVRRVADLPPWMVNAPFSLPLHLAFASRGARFLHAASLGLDGRGLLLAGAGGAGKSATTIAGLLNGLSTVGDDYLVLEAGETATAWPVYRTLKQSPSGLDRFPALRRRTAGLPLNWHGKVELDADLVRADCIASSLEIDAIMIPEQSGSNVTTIAPASPTAAFSALAPSTLSQLPGEGLAGFALLTRLTRMLPAYSLHLSNDPDEIGAALRDFLARREA